MSKNAVYDRPIVIGLIIGSIIAIVIFHFAWWSKFTQNLSNPVFAVGYGILMGACTWEAIKAYQYAEDDRKDGKRKVLLLLVVLLLGWLGGWAVGSNEKKMMEDDINKAKVESLFTDSNHLPGQIPQP